MLSSTARGIPRFSITSERRSSSTCRRSLPKLVRARRAETTMLSFFCVLGIESTHQLDYTNCTVSSATVFEHFYACADHLVEERQAMRLVGLLSPACALGLMSTALLIAATTAEYATQYFVASSTSVPRIAPPNSNRTAG